MFDVRLCCVTLCVSLFGTVASGGVYCDMLHCAYNLSDQNTMHSFNTSHPAVAKIVASLQHLLSPVEIVGETLTCPTHRYVYVPTKMFSADDNNNDPNVKYSRMVQFEFVDICKSEGECIGVRAIAGNSTQCKQNIVTRKYLAKQPDGREVLEEFDISDGCSCETS